MRKRGRSRSPRLQSAQVRCVGLSSSSAGDASGSVSNLPKPSLERAPRARQTNSAKQKPISNTKHGKACKTQSKQAAQVSKPPPQGKICGKAKALKTAGTQSDKGIPALPRMPKAQCKKPGAAKSTAFKRVRKKPVPNGNAEICSAGSCKWLTPKFEIPGTALFGVRRCRTPSPHRITVRFL